VSTGRMANPLDPLLAPDGHELSVGAAVDRLLQPELETAIAALEGSAAEAPLLALMGRYHLGWCDSSGEPTSPAVRRSAQGKRLRPVLAFLCCAATGGRMQTAAPLAVAIELLHNFTLIHDDIQDRSPNRRHRATVWRVWGDGQAINAGDALFAAAHLALFRLAVHDVPAGTVLRLAAAFERMTLDIVRGQVLDLGFEGRDDVTPDHYLTMIRGKTAAILRFASWAGALIAGAEEEVAGRFGEFGEALGLGFQLRDDMLGIWGTHDATGKDAADDIRRRKQSLPILLLRQAATEDERMRLDALYGESEIGEAGIAEVLASLERHGVEEQVAAQVAAMHDRAAAALWTALAGAENDAAGGLRALVDRLSARDG
jgi:geranylgeranyl diphosphate synthase, type I